MRGRLARRVLLAGRVVALVKSCTLIGIDAVPVDVECEVVGGQVPSFSVVGLAAPAVKEGSARIRAALHTVEHDLPQRHVTINLAPADIRKSTGALDLAIAIAVLIADGAYDGASFANLIVLGELGLDGGVRPVKGVLAAAMLARERGLRGVVVPAANAREATVVDGIEVYIAEHIADIVAALAGSTPLARPAEGGKVRRSRRRATVDLSEVRGQQLARCAIEIAVAGGHNLLLAGPPGTGKTMLARRIGTVLPAMTRSEALETTKVYSAMGLADGLMDERPFRSPHHTISTSALIGGGSIPRPGEISLAHNGVLFLDELPEFSRAAIESLRQPLEDRTVTIGRVHGTIKAPASFLLVAAANPCPCGWLGSTARECTCSAHALERYTARLSGPLMDRIDLQVYVQQVKLTELRKPEPCETSASVRERVVAARERQQERLRPYGLGCNAEMPSAVLRATCRLDAAGERSLTELVERRRTLTARGIDRLLKVARTIADLTDRDDIDAGCLHEAAAFRTVDPTIGVLAA